MAHIMTILFVLYIMILSTHVHGEDIMTKLSPPDGATSDWFGEAVSIHGETAIIGSMADDSARGSAYIFERQSSENWTFIQKIVASDRSVAAYFGSSLSVYEETVIIGAYGNDSVYIFERQTNGIWIEVQKLTGSDTVSGDNFGAAVSIYEDIAVIGAYFDNENEAYQSGSAFIFQQQSNGQWVELQKLRASDASLLSYFGFAVDIYNNTIIVGAWIKKKAYIFEESNNGTWIEANILSAASGEFGYAVSIYGNNLIVGASGGAGSAYVYTETDSGLWQWNQTLVASDASSSDYFGSSVSIYNQTMVIGAYGDDDKESNSGSAYIFNKVAGGSWIESAKITAFDGSVDGAFGCAVSVYNDDILIGARTAEDQSGSQTGAGYVMKNWNSCNEIWIESDDDQTLVNATNRYLVSWQWTNCTFTPTQQPTGYRSYTPSQSPIAQPSFEPTIEPTVNPSAHLTTFQTTFIPDSSSTNISTTTTLMEETDGIYTIRFSEEVLDYLWIVILVVVVCILNPWALFMCHRYYKKKDAKNEQDALP